MIGSFLLLGWMTAQAEIPLNQATAAQLAEIEGISGAQAADIVALRGERGRISSVEALRILPGMDSGGLNALRQHTTLDLPIRRGSGNYQTVEQVMGAFAGEPSIREVQGMAMDYSHTHAAQVENWLAADRPRNRR